MHRFAIIVIVGDKILIFLHIGVHAGTWFWEYVNVKDLKMMQSIAQVTIGVLSFLILYFFVNSLWLQRRISIPSFKM